MKNLFIIPVLLLTVGASAQQITVRCNVADKGSKLIVSYWKAMAFKSDTLNLTNSAASLGLQFSEPAYIRFQNIEPAYTSPFFLAYPGDTLLFAEDSRRILVKGGPGNYNQFLLHADSARRAFADKRPDAGQMAAFLLQQSDNFFAHFTHPKKQSIQAAHELSVITNSVFYPFIVKHAGDTAKINSLARLIRDGGSAKQMTDEDLKLISRIKFNSGETADAHIIDLMMMNNLVRILRFQAVKQDSALQDTDPYVIESQIIRDLFQLGRYRSRLLAVNLYSRIRDYLEYPMQLTDADRFIADFKQENPGGELAAPIESLYVQQLQNIGSLARGAKAPAFRLPDIHGKPVSLSDFRGKVVYLDLWASWCAPCLAEMPYMKTLRQKFKGKDVELVSVSIDTHKDRWLDKVGSAKLEGIQLIDSRGSENSRIAKDYKIHGVPHYVLIDKKGNIALPYAPRPSSGAEIEHAINGLLK